MPAATFVATPLTTRVSGKRRAAVTPAPPPKRFRACRTLACITAENAVSTFEPRPFVPYLSSNPHFQTILSNYYPSAPTVEYVRFLLNSDDSQAVLSVDVSPPHPSLPTLPSSNDSQPISVPSTLPTSNPSHPKPSPIVVVLHGLESNSDATVTRRIVSAMLAHSFTCYVLNLRSCEDPAAAPTTLRLYHAGFTEDLETLLRHIRISYVNQQLQPPDVYLCGFSLGANIVCQFVGRSPELAQEYGIVSAAGACVPFDPTGCQAKLDRGLRGVFYSRYLVETMQVKFRNALKAGVDIGDCSEEDMRRANRIGRIDDYLIVPVFGFKDRFDYYQRIDSRKILKNITIPTLVINSLDDPFFDHKEGKGLPTEDSIQDAPVILHLTKHGGHCGFLDEAMFKKETPGYFQTEFARFFDHVRQWRLDMYKKAENMSTEQVGQ